MSKVLVCGSFDPITLGHEDLIRRASVLFDEVVVCIFENTTKKYFFGLETRLNMVCETVKKYPNVTVDSSCGLVAEYCLENGIDFIVKGLRDTVDFEYESAVARVNEDLGRGLQTLFISSAPEYSHISSTVAREYIKYGKPTNSVLPSEAADLIK